MVYVEEKNCLTKEIDMAKGRGFVEGHDESVGKGSHANMPQDLMMREYPKPRMGADRMLDDSMSDIDDLQGEAASKRNKYISDQK